MKVLVIDDDPVIRATLESNLQKWGYQPVIAETAEAGWDILQAQDAPKLAIIDWQLPGMNGIEICKIIKSCESEFCYIIMLTGRISSDDVVVGLESGADDYIVKPVDAAELRARLMAGQRILKRIDCLSSTDNTRETPEINNSPCKLQDSFASLKILIAEDDPVSREVLQENLKRWGFSVIVAENGQQAVEAFQAHKGPLLGIIDWMMPKLSGVEVCQKIRETAEPGLCYLILLTAKSQREDIVEGLESGADDYLTKPFHSAELRARINTGIRIITANKHIKAIFSYSSDGIITFDRNGLIESFNPAAEKIFHYPSHNIVGKAFTFLIAGGVEQKKFASLLENLSSESSLVIELTGIRSDSSVFPMELSVAQMSYDSYIHKICVIRDISDKKEQEKKLLLAKEQAEQASKAKSQFLSNVSHELRTPLNAILGFAQLLESDDAQPLSEEQRESVDYILKGGIHLLGLVNEILDLAQIEKGKMFFNYTAVDVDNLLQDCLCFMKQLAENNQVTIELSSTTFANFVSADAQRLKQIVLNLLSNAIKYNKHPGLVFIEKSQPQPGLLRISIKDTGWGISKEKQGELFQSFNRLGAEALNIEGTGIGLLISKNLIDGMGGSIGVESVEGEGSTFWIQLPTLASE